MAIDLINSLVNIHYLIADGCRVTLKSTTKNNILSLSLSKNLLLILSIFSLSQNLLLILSIYSFSLCSLSFSLSKNLLLPLLIFLSFQKPFQYTLSLSLAESMGVCLIKGNNFHIRG